MRSVTLRMASRHGRRGTTLRELSSRRLREAPAVAATTTTRRRFLSSNANDDKLVDDKSKKKSLVPSNNDNDQSTTPSIPIDFDVSSKIEGEESQIVTINLQPGQRLRAESGAMIYMTSGIEMETTTGGMSDGFKRMLTGQNLFVTDFTYNGNTNTSGEVALGTDFPSKIVKLSLEDYGGKLVCQRGAYLASNPTVNIEMEFTMKFSTGFFGGEGFILQSLTGEGDVFVKAGGTLVKKELAEGETLRISSGSLVAFSPQVEFDIQMMPGFKNVMFGGEGLFVTTLKGPGTVWLQGLPPDRMISEIARRVPAGGLGFGIPIGMGGGGGAGEEAAGAAGEEPADVAAGEEVGGEEMVAATDAAVEADRQATVASSGMMGADSGENVDSESPSALFGDAAPPGQDSPGGFGDDSFADAGSGSFGASTDDSFSSGAEPSFKDSDFPEMEETSSFSTDDFQDSQFKDETSFSTFDEGSSGASSSDVFDSESTEDVAEGAGSILQTLWDFFTGGD